MNQLSAGQKSPEFTVLDLSGKRVSLRDFRGKKVLLSLFRDAACPFCNLRVRELARNYSKLEEKGIVVLAVFHSTRDRIMEFSGKESLPFLIVPDPDEKLYQLFRLQRSLLGKMKSMVKFGKMKEIMSEGLFNLQSMNQPNTLPADFLIDENGQIIEAYYGKDFGDHLDVNTILKRG